MKKLFTLLLISFSFSAIAQNFTAGNLIVYRAGDSTAAVTSNGTAVFLDEYSLTGTRVQSLALPTSIAGANKRLVCVGTAGTEGFLSLSVDKQYVVATGYDAAVGTASLASSSSATTARVVARVDATKSINTTTALNAFSGSAIRGVCSTNGTDIWLSGASTGSLYTTLGSTTATTVSSTVTNLRNTYIYNGQLYASTASGTFSRVQAVGTGIPTVTGNAMTNLSGVSTTNTSSNGFYMATINGVTVLYLASDATGGGLLKYILNAGSWVLSGNIVTLIRGLTGKIAGNDIELYATNSSGLNILKFTDIGASTSNIGSGTFTTIATAPTNTLFKGICFAPELPVTATLSVSPSSISLNTTTNTASASQSFNVTASTLTPAAGNLTITPSSGLEFSFDNIAFSSTAQTLAYAGSAVASTPIYVRITNTAPQGAVSGSITISGGGAATNAVVTVTGGVFQNYYNKPVGDLTATSSWGTNADGSGTLPADFATAYQVFNMVKNNNLGAPWDISGTSSKLIIGDGSAAITLSTTLTDTLKATVITDVLDNAVFNISNKIPPALGSLTSASKIIFSYNATATTDTIKIPTLNYGFLTLQNGLKYFKSGITTVNADLVFDNVVNANGAASPFSTISLKGNLSMVGTSNFEDSTTGSGNRLTLSMAGTGTQNIFTNGNELSIFRLIRDTAIGTTNVNIDLGTNSKITLGNNTSGGLSLLQKAAGTPTTTTLNLSGTTQMALVKNGVVTDVTNNRVGNINATGGTIILNKTIANTATQGVLRFAANSVLDALTVNITTPAKDSIIINDDLSINNALTLTDGKIIMATGKILKMNASSAITGGAVGSFVEGILSNTAASGNINFPVGKGTKYAPVTVGILTGSNRYDVLYANSGYGTYTIGTSTLATYPNYNVSQKEYWNITPAATATADVSLFYTDNKTINANPTSLRGAHFNATNNSWDDKGNANTGSNTLINGQVTMLGVDDFSPFTFAADIAGVLPIKLTNFTAVKDGKIVKIQFTTGQEINTKWHIVEQSTDTKNWKTVATLTAAGNAALENIYDAVDLLPAKGTNYYRIKTKDIDGRANYSMIKSVLFSFSFEIAVSPNPVSNILTVLVAKPNSNGALISIVNTVGAKVYEQSTKDASIKINIENLAKGTYFVKALQGENVSVKKIIVQ